MCIFTDDQLQINRERVSLHIKYGPEGATKN